MKVGVGKIANLVWKKSGKSLEFCSPKRVGTQLIDLKYFLSKEFGIFISESKIIVHLLWADDLIFISDSPIVLQRQLDGLYIVCRKYQMIVNTSKSKVLIFGKHENAEFYFNNAVVDFVDEYKYTGIIFNSGG